MAAAGDSGVTFQNDSDHKVRVFARYGSDDVCRRRAKEVELIVAAGTSSTVHSGAFTVCFCLDVPQRNSCPTGWSEVEPGGRRVLH